MKRVLKLNFMRNPKLAHILVYNHKEIFMQISLDNYGILFQYIIGQRQGALAPSDDGPE